VNECRTVPRSTEMVFAGLVGTCFIVGFGLIVGSLVGGFTPVIAVEVIFLAVALQQDRLLLFRTACQLSIDHTLGVVRWKSTLGDGAIPISAIDRVDRSSRPSVYTFRCSDRTEVEFWLMMTDTSVQDFFKSLAAENPLISMGEVYRKGRLWWRGLPPAV
jgi:hypothetical protein